MLLDKPKIYALMVISALLLILCIIQTSRLHTTQLLKKSVEIILANEQRDAAERLAEAEGKARSTEQQMQSNADQYRKQTNEQVTAHNAQRDSLLARVRLAEAKAKRLSEASSAASAGTVTPGDIDTELLGTLGPEDVEEAHRANIIRDHLISCYKQYDDARLLLSQ